MKRTLKRLVVLLVVAAAVWWVWSNRDRLEVLSNNNVRIQGEWHPVKMDFNEPDTYLFAEGIISKDGFEWGAYVFRKSTRLEVTVRGSPARCLHADEGEPPPPVRALPMPLVMKAWQTGTSGDRIWPVGLRSGR